MLVYAFKCTDLVIYSVLIAVTQSKCDPSVLIKKLKFRLKSWPKVIKLTVSLKAVVSALICSSPVPALLWACMGCW